MITRTTFAISMMVMGAIGSGIGYTMRDTDCIKSLAILENTLLSIGRERMFESMLEDMLERGMAPLRQWPWQQQVPGGETCPTASCSVEKKTWI